MIKLKATVAALATLLAMPAYANAYRVDIRNECGVPLSGYLWLNNADPRYVAIESLRSLTLSYRPPLTLHFDLGAKGGPKWQWAGGKVKPISPPRTRCDATARYSYNGIWGVDSGRYIEVSFCRLSPFFDSGAVYPRYQEKRICAYRDSSGCRIFLGNGTERGEHCRHL